MPPRERTTTAAVAVAAGSIGVVTWIATMASAPRYSYGAEEDLGSSALYYVLLGTALAGGVLQPKRAWLVGIMLGLPPLLLSPWTAPRGDNDGLWILIVPMLAFFLFVLIATAYLGAWIRTRLTSTRSTGAP
jgi:hypothetical protein